MPNQDATSSSSNLTPTHGVLLVIGTAGVTLFVLGYLFRPRKRSS